MAGKHGELLRGLSAVKSSPLFQGRFGRMFRNLTAATFGDTDEENESNLEALGAAMSADFDPPKDGKDEEESGIPSLYTYFGQFIDHDITFDPMSSLIKQNDPDGLVDFRTPALDLDNVYGRGPGDQPYMYDGPRGEFLLGKPLSGGGKGATDLPRNSRGRAIIGDPRNDENSIVSQLQGLLLRFHNRLIADNPNAPFDEVQQMLRFHYQYVVLNDFLPRIISKKVLDALRVDGRYAKEKFKFLHWRNTPFIPVEFSVAAYRLGHSMVRPGYRLNDDDAMLLPIFPVPKFPKGLTGFQTMEAGRAIDWGRFIDIDLRDYDGSTKSQKNRLQLAYRIDTSLVNPLSNLPPSVVSDRPPSLGARNLIRAWRLGLPSGQDVARAMHVKPLADKEILIGQALDEPDKPLQNITKVAGGAFADNCPLWTYILAEAIQHKESVEAPVKEKISIMTPKLGLVGGRIVAEVFLGLMFGDGRSMLSIDPHWHPKSGKNFALKDMVNYALGNGPKL